MCRRVRLSFESPQTVQRPGPYSARADEVSAQFQTQVLRPLMVLATEAPDEAQRVISLIRDKLEALDLLLEGSSAPSNGSGAVQGGGGHHAVNGVQFCGGEAARSELDDVGRNQRSRIREMTLLEVLSSEARPFSLQQLMRALEGDGFADGSAAVVSQLHRMKKVGLIEQPGNGMYEVTQEGLGHLRRLRASFGALVR